jgi:hypothetical protein
LEKYRTIAQHQPAIRQLGFFGFGVTKILNRFLMALLAIVIFSVNKYQTSSKTRHLTPTAVEENITEPLITPSSTQYSCQGKTYCSEMSSCEEAQFYQSNCSGTKMDGDGDGVPCEDMCGH